MGAGFGEGGNASSEGTVDEQTAQGMPANQQRRTQSLADTVAHQQLRIPLEHQRGFGSAAILLEFHLRLFGISAVIQKYNIYLPGYSRLLTSIIAKEDSFSTVTEETQQRLVERLIDLLRANDKKQSFVFQNECLEACQRMLVYKNRPIKDSTVLYNCEKMLEEYLWKKPTRECAFACKESLITAKKSLEQ